MNFIGHLKNRFNDLNTCIITIACSVVSSALTITVAVGFISFNPWILLPFAATLLVIGVAIPLVEAAFSYIKEKNKEKKQTLPNQAAENDMNNNLRANNHDFDAPIESDASTKKLNALIKSDASIKELNTLIKLPVGADRMVNVAELRNIAQRIINELDLIDEIAKELEVIPEQRNQYFQLFYLDTVKDILEIKAATTMVEVRNIAEKILFTTATTTTRDIIEQIKKENEDNVNDHEIKICIENIVDIVKEKRKTFQPFQRSINFFKKKVKVNQNISIGQNTQRRFF